MPPAGNMTRQRAIKTPPSDGGAACGVLVCNENSLEILKRSKNQIGDIEYDTCPIVTVFAIHLDKFLTG